MCAAMVLGTLECRATHRNLHAVYEFAHSPDTKITRLPSKTLESCCTTDAYACR